MNNHCWYELKSFPVNILKPEFPIKSLRASATRIMALQSDNFSDEMIAWARERQIVLSIAMSFYRFNNVLDSAPHIDISNSKGDVCSPAFNIQMCGTGIMYFYKLLPGIARPVIQYTLAQTPYLELGYDQIEKIDESLFGPRAQLVRTDVPHKVHLTEAPRHVLSVRIHTIGGQIPTWGNVTEALANDLIPR